MQCCGCGATNEVMNVLCTGLTYTTECTDIVVCLHCEQPCIINLSRIDLRGRYSPSFLPSFLPFFRPQSHKFSAWIHDARTEGPLGHRPSLLRVVEKNLDSWFYCIYPYPRVVPDPGKWYFCWMRLFSGSLDRPKVDKNEGKSCYTVNLQCKISKPLKWVEKIRLGSPSMPPCLRPSFNISLSPKWVPAPNMPGFLSNIKYHVGIFSTAFQL